MAAIPAAAALVMAGAPALAQGSYGYGYSYNTGRNPDDRYVYPHFNRRAPSASEAGGPAPHDRRYPDAERLRERRTGAWDDGPGRRWRGRGNLD